MTRRAAVIAIAVFAIASIAASLGSQGFLDNDAATHYLFARYALHEPFYLVNVWGRPLATALDAPAAAFGRCGVHAVSLACAIGCALVAWRMAGLEEVGQPALAVVFTLGQPLLFLHSFSEMTELPFALVCGLAFIGYRERRWWLLAIAAGLLPLGRPEGFGFLLLAAVVLVMRRRWELGSVVIPTFAWDVAGWIIEGKNGPWWKWLVTAWPYAARSDYPPGPLAHYLLLLPVIVSPVAAPAVIVGIWRRRRSALAAIPVAVLVVHSVLFWLGRFSSSGEARYLLIVAPFWGVLAANGWEYIFSRLAWRQPIAWAAAGVLAAGQINWAIPMAPQSLPENWRGAERLVEWLEHSDYSRLMYAHPAIGYFLDAGGQRRQSLPWNRGAIRSCPPGVLLIWDRELSARNADPNRDITLADLHSWREIAAPPGVGPDWRLFVSQASNSTLPP